MFVSAPAASFQSIETLFWPESGRFPAYTPEPPDGHIAKFSVFTGLMHDSNLFRLSDNANPASDTIARFGARVDAALPVSRQRILFIAEVDRRDYDNFGFLDHTAYRLGGTWKWLAGSQWSGDLAYGRRKYLSSFGEQSPQQARFKDMITADRAYATAIYQVTARWRGRGALDWWQFNHSNPSQTDLDNRTGSGTIGFDYITPANNSVGGQFKYTDGNYYNRQQVTPGVFVDNQYREHETSLVAHWIVTGKSTLDARVGYTKREHEQLPQRDFGGFTGRLSYDWFVGAKTILNFALWRELRSIEDLTASYVVAQGGSFGPSWAPTDKIVVQGRFVYEKRDYDGDPGFVLTGGPQQQETFRGLNLSMGWTPRRSIELAIAAERGDRSSNVAGRDYDYTAVMGNAKFRF